MRWLPRAVGGLTGIAMQALEEAPGAGEALGLQRKLTGMPRLPTKSVPLGDMSAWMGPGADPARLHDAPYGSALTSGLFAPARTGGTGRWPARCAGGFAKA